MAKVNTIYGEMEESELRKVEGGHENDNEIVSWVEYYLGEELVHRSVAMHLKQAIFSFGESAALA
jgi:hypothetical protein